MVSIINVLEYFLSLEKKNQIFFCDHFPEQELVFLSDSDRILLIPQESWLHCQFSQLDVALGNGTVVNLTKFLKREREERLGIEGERIILF